ncbi:MAG: dipeptidase, partial [Chlorobiales bacterium]|nr:dipeptidase [Chlorobiales bacterium]
AETIFADARAIAFTQSNTVFDCLGLFYVLDEPYATRCLEAGVNICNVTFAFESSWDQTMRAVEEGFGKIEKSDVLALATNSAEIAQANDAGKLAVIPGTQGSSMIGKDLARVGILARLGFRFFGLAYTGATLFADGCGETRDAGVSFLGEELIQAVNETPMILDLSHTGHRSRAEAVPLARAPVCTHSNAWDHVPNDRNTKDETAQAIVAKGGMMGACCLPLSVSPKDPTLDDLIDHIDHDKALIGAENIGIGLDFTEAYKESKVVLPESIRWRTLRPDIFGTVDDFVTQRYPTGSGGIRELPNLTHRLFERGYTDDEVAGILGGNWLRTFTTFVG